MGIVGNVEGSFAKTPRECRYVELRARMLMEEGRWWESTCPEGVGEAKHHLNIQLQRLIESGKKDLIEQIKKDMYEDSLEESAFSWIKNGGKRAIFFVFLYIDININLELKRATGLPSNFTNAALSSEWYMLRIYSHFDMARSFGRNVDRASKQHELLNIKARWDALPSADWLMGMNSSQLIWAKNYFDKNDFTPELMRVSVNENSFDELQMLVVGIVDINDGSASEKELFIRKMKGAWASKKNRENGKKNLNYQISPEAFSHLAELAEHHDCSKSKMLERLIKWEYQEIKKKK